MLKHKTIVNAVALAVGSMALFSGCAAPTAATSPASSSGLSIEPVLAVRDGVDAERQYRIGRQLQGQRRNAGAEEAFLKAIALDPGHAEARNALGVLYYSQGLIQKAEEQFELAIAAAPDRAHLYNNLGYLYQEIGRTEDAINALSEALRLDPNNPRILNNLAALTCEDKGMCTATTPASPADAPRQASQALPEPATSSATAPAPREALAQPQSQSQSQATVQLASVAPNVWELRPVASATRTAALSAAPTPAPRTDAAANQPAPRRRIEVANGNGVTGLAKRVGGYLREQGYPAARLTNHSTFTQRHTEVQYVPGAESLARQLSNSLAGPSRLVPVARLDRQIPVRLVLGKDFNESQAMAKEGRSDTALAVIATAPEQH